MPLGFVDDAISLSGLTGTRLKCDVVGEYYRFWWKITSGGETLGWSNKTAFVELDAATGEVHIKDTDETVLGSAGHVMDIKANGEHTENLKVVLIERDPDCYSKLKRVIRRRWPKIDLPEAENGGSENDSNVYLMNLSFNDAIDRLIEIELGNSMFYFDPLRGVTFDSIETVAAGRMNSFYKTGTEFLIFVFTSDWFLGRDDFSTLPSNNESDKWSEGERKTVEEADLLFGDQEWRPHILTGDTKEIREEKLIGLYRERLHRWFRYVLPLPFNPKIDQLFHLILCSNYEAGVRATRNFYSNKTGNPLYRPDNSKAYDNFKKLHPELLRGLTGNRRPVQWRILWNTITEHEEGLCDGLCPSFKQIGGSSEIHGFLSWLNEHGYLKELEIKDAWDSSVKQYVLNWKNLKDKLGVDPPLPLRPLSPEMFNNG